VAATLCLAKLAGGPAGSVRHHLSKPLCCSRAHGPESAAAHQACRRCSPALPAGSLTECVLWVRRCRTLTSTEVQPASAGYLQNTASSTAPPRRNRCLLALWLTDYCLTESLRFCAGSPTHRRARAAPLHAGVGSSSQHPFPCTCMPASRTCREPLPHPPFGVTPRQDVAPV
jgi:hypothetical protein